MTLVDFGHCTGSDRVPPRGDRDESWRGDGGVGVCDRGGGAAEQRGRGGGRAVQHLPRGAGVGCVHGAPGEAWGGRLHGAFGAHAGGDGGADQGGRARLHEDR